MAGETLPSGSTNTQGLADWAAPYITNYLGKAQALSETPYQAYQGPLTAGASNLQTKVFQGLAGLTFPSNLGQSFASPVGGMQQPISMSGAAPTAQVQRAAPTEADWNTFQQTAMFTPDTDMAKVKADFMSGGGKNVGGSDMGALPIKDFMPQQGGTTPSGIAGLQPPQASMQPSTIAQTYMNPYLQSVLNPQLDELQRRSQVNLQPDLAKLTQAGGFGGSRQALLQGESGRNLLQEQNKTVGQGYANAYDKAMQQFNTEQGQAKDLVNLMAGQGATERGIDAEGIAADKEEFEKQRQYPFQQVQWQRDMISGLPTGSVTNQAGQMSGIGSFLNALGGGTAAASALGYKNVGELLKGLGLDFGPTP